MQTDFHFYSIYVLCRCNGMSPGNSKVVAYASQHTDDAKYDQILNFENGGQFQQILTAHKYVHPGVLSVNTQYQVYVPFHFIPGNEGDRFQERMVCEKNSEIARQIVEETISLKNKPYQLHRLGIALHAYADTWSHQNFSGLQTELNDIEDIDVINENRTGIAKIFTDFFRNTVESLIPQIGHAEAALLPDEPYRKWSFNHVYQKRPVFRDNRLICRDACKNIYEKIKSFLAKNYEYSNGKFIHWSKIESIFTSLFEQKGDLEERCHNWISAINNSIFGFACHLVEKDLLYNDREWFEFAVEVRERGGVKKYYRKEDFHVSNWKYFHDAATSHRFFVLKELLSSRGIVCR